MSAEVLWVGLVAVALGGLVHGTLGIGFPMVATPIIALATDVRTAILLTLVPTMTVNLVSIYRGGRWGESLGRHWPVAAWVLAGSVLGTWLLMVSDPAPLRLLLAALILFYLYSGAVRRLGMWSWIGRHPRLSGAGFGAAAGVLAGTVNVAVPVLIIYFTELGLAPTALVQILNLCFLGGKLAQAGTFGLGGQFTAQAAALSLPLTAMAGLTLAAGIGLRERVDATTYRRWLRRVLLVIAGVLILQYLAGY